MIRNAMFQAIKLFCYCWPFQFGRGRLQALAISLYPKDSPVDVVVNSNGMKLRANLTSNTGWALFLYSRWFERNERKFINQHLGEIRSFLDIGANLGFYSVFVGSRNSFRGKVFAVEASPSVFQDFVKNIELNHLNNIVAKNVGVSDRNEVLEFHIHPSNYGGSSFIKKEGCLESIPIRACTLRDLVGEFGLTAIDFLKIDIEGLEYRVLSKFFEEADRQLFPKFVLTEYHEKWKQKAGGSTVDLLLANGYKLLKVEGINYYLQRQADLT